MITIGSLRVCMAIIYVLKSVSRRNFEKIYEIKQIPKICILKITRLKSRQICIMVIFRLYSKE